MSLHTLRSLSIFIFKPQRGSKSAETHTKMTKLEWRDTQLESTNVLILLIILQIGFLVLQYDISSIDCIIEVAVG